MGVIMLKSLPHVYENFIETLNITTTNVDVLFEKLWNKVLL